MASDPKLEGSWSWPSKNFLVTNTASMLFNTKHGSPGEQKGASCVHTHADTGVTAGPLVLTSLRTRAPL